jgi:bifunctional DNA-binding transcriptional regulator/antitoxin component of YhaV-PrlF toxin-antitoxin module
MSVIHTGKVISNNRVFLSPKVRERLNVVEGDFIQFSEGEEGKVIIKKN